MTQLPPRPSNTPASLALPPLTEQELAEMVEFMKVGTTEQDPSLRMPGAYKLDVGVNKKENSGENVLLVMAKAVSSVFQASAIKSVPSSVPANSAPTADSSRDVAALDNPSTNSLPAAISPSKIIVASSEPKQSNTDSQALTPFPTAKLRLIRSPV